MKITFKILSLLFLLAFCLPTVNASATIVSLHNEEVSKTLKSASDKGAITTASFSVHTKEFDRIIVEQLTTNTPVIFIKHLDTGKAIAASSKHLFVIAYSKYIQFLKNLNLNFLTIDIIYPFHSFW
ncbi:hypothetical protein ES677_00285 [Bizionia gelidisalsuginis]|uniref:Uncharacterized protein n=2 Tax=Bizionia TaxID=283785 RepID=A0A8H2LEZ6_9FLAO|nr:MULTISPECIES: hypothetical protein [Bizionia]TYB77471.1 hypothetical protein ES676_04025 [Bizionia saleffrena]TYC17848.1 hypothetical protein ES677_00285 [Bizionia gelidisalsuginis]